MKIKLLLLFAVLISLVSLGVANTHTVQDLSKGITSPDAKDSYVGHWYVAMQTAAGDLPFELTINKSKGGGSYSGEIFDGNHRVNLENFRTEGNKLTFGIDDARVRFELSAQNQQLIGKWIRKGASSSTELPLVASSTPRSVTAGRPASDFVGDWQCFTVGDTKTPIDLIIREKAEAIKNDPIDKDRSLQTPTIAPKTAKKSLIEGTGIDPTGDFGKMVGEVVDLQLVLSRFDGQSLSMVVVSRVGDQLNANVSTSPKSQFAITGVKKGSGLPDPGSVAKVNPNINFAFPNTKGDSIKFPSEAFKGKVVLIDIMGTWCHNCHDETPFLVEMYNKYHAKGLEIVGICFEAQETEAEDLKAIDRYQRSRKIPYQLLYAGKLEDGAPAKTIAGLEKFGGYPTNIFISRNGEIAATHTGFWGPATGEKHVQIKQEFEETIERLLNK